MKTVWCHLSFSISCMWRFVQLSLLSLCTLSDKFQIYLRFIITIFLLPANKVWGKIIFTQVSVCPQGCVADTLPGQTSPRNGHWSGRYASYWNAFLSRFAYEFVCAWNTKKDQNGCQRSHFDKKNLSDFKNDWWCIMCDIMTINFNHKDFYHRRTSNTKGSTSFHPHKSTRRDTSRIHPVIVTSYRVFDLFLPQILTV